MLRYVIHYHPGVVQKVKLGPFPTPFSPASSPSKSGFQLMGLRNTPKPGARKT